MNFKKLTSFIENHKKEFKDFSLRLNSKEIKRKDIFVSLANDPIKNELHIEDAVKKGASAIITSIKTKEDLTVPVIYFLDLKNKLSDLANFFYEDPSKKLNLFGITGTNGKSTTAYFLYQLLNQNNFNSSLLSNIKNNRKGVFFSKLTTPDILSLNKFFFWSNTINCDCAIIEVSSHAIDQKRIKGLSFDYGCFTNISRDHLDYHGTMKEYSRIKESFFSENSFKSALINIDTPLGKKIYKSKSNFLSFSSSFRNADFYLDKENFLHFKNQSYDLHFFSKQDFLITNLAMAVSLAILLKPKINLKNINKLSTPKGRFEKIQVFNNKYCIIDYAHTPSAIETVLKDIKKNFTGSKISIFGCGGNRDKGKRSKMGKIVEKFSDEILITTDNPRFEDPIDIYKDITSGISNRKKTSFIPDREKAIKEGLKILSRQKKDSVLLIAGKGHENYQEVKGERFPLNDKNILKDLISVN